MECQALSDVGTKCKSKAVGTVSYHGAEEYHQRYGCGCPRWVEVSFCKKHLKRVKRE